MKNPIAWLALAFALVACAFSYHRTAHVPHLAFVDTQRLMLGFKEALEANKQIKAEDEKWKGNLKVMEDSLKSFMDTMTVKYDKAGLKEKKDLQEELGMRNQQINNYTAAQNKKMQEVASKDLQGVYDKINAFMKEYGKAKGYDIVFGTSQGNILYGEGTVADITDDVIQALNKRYN